jgi:hypothetical protein
LATCAPEETAWHWSPSQLGIAKKAGVSSTTLVDSLAYGLPTIVDVVSGQQIQRGTGRSDGIGAIITPYSWGVVSLYAHPCRDVFAGGRGLFCCGDSTSARLAAAFAAAAFTPAFSERTTSGFQPRARSEQHPDNPDHPPCLSSHVVARKGTIAPVFWSSAGRTISLRECGDGGVKTVYGLPRNNLLCVVTLASG